jgi:hypothetical protein
MNDTTFLQLPLSLATADPNLIKVYLTLVSIAVDNGGKEIYLPCRKERARLYGVNHARAVDLETELQTLNLIRVQVAGGDGFKNARRRIIVKYTVVTQAAVELVEPRKEYTLPDDIHTLKKSCRNRDTQRKTLADFSDQELYILSGGASNQDIRQAIVEVENFRPTNRAPIYSIKQAFASRFLDGKLKENRKGQIAAASKPAALPAASTAVEPPVGFDPETRTYLLTAMELGARVFPDRNYTPEQIDSYVALVNTGGMVQTSMKPQSLLRLFDKSPDAFYVDGDSFMLRAGYQLERLHPGYYRLKTYEAAL